MKSPFWPLMSSACLLVFAAIYLALTKPSMRRSGAPTDSRRILSGDSTSRMMDVRTRLDEARRLGRDRVLEGVPLLRKFADDKDPEVRIACVRSLGEIGDADSVQAVLNRVPDKDPRVRIEATAAMGKLYGERADDGLRDLLKDEEPSVRQAAARALAGVADKQTAAQHLLGAMDDVDANVRLIAVESLMRASADMQVRAVSKALMHADPGVRGVGQQAMARIGRDVIPSLRESLGPQVSAEARADAARLLGQLGDVRSVPTLLRLLESTGQRAPPSPALSQAVVDALTALGEKALPLIVEEAISEEAEGAAERAAIEACRRIGKVSAGPIRQALLKWKLFPDTAELGLWLALLGELGDADGAAAVRKSLWAEAGGGDKVDPSSIRPLRGPVTTIMPTKRQASDLPRTGVVRLFLDKALFQREQNRAGLHLDLVRRDGQWTADFLGFGRGFNDRVFRGRIARHEQSGAETKLWLDLIAQDDRFIKGGVADYQVSIRAVGGILRGEYSGQFNFLPARGEAQVSAWAQTFVDDPRPLKPAEHPRLLFRREHLPVLQRKARTDIGRRIIEAMRLRLVRDKTQYLRPMDIVTNWESGMDLAIGHAALGLLLDDASHTRRALRLFDARWRVLPYGGEHGERLPVPLTIFPFAYDLLYHHLPAEDRAGCSARMAARQNFFSLDFGPVGVFSAGNPPFGYCTTGLSALAALHEPGAFVMTPPDDAEAVVTLTAPADLGSHEGVPVNEFAANKLITEWLLCGPFDLPADTDPLESLGGRFKARPRKDTAIPYLKGSLRFVPLPADVVAKIGGLQSKSGHIVVPVGESDSRSYLYSLVKINRLTGCMADFSLPFGGRPNIWISGQRIPDGAKIILEPGLHPVLVEMVGPVARPCFAAFEAFTAKGLAARRKWLVERYERLKAEHARHGQFVDTPIALEEARYGLREYFILQYGRLRDEGEAPRNDLDFFFPGALWMALGEPFWPDTPLPLVDDSDAALIPRLGDRTLIYMLGMAQPKFRAALVSEFGRRFPSSQAMARLHCADIVTALVTYPMGD